MKIITLKVNDNLLKEIRLLAGATPGGNVTNSINILLEEALEYRKRDSE